MDFLDSGFYYVSLAATYILEFAWPALILFIFLRMETEIKWLLYGADLSRNKQESQAYEYHWLHAKTDEFQGDLNALLSQGFHFFDGSQVTMDPRGDTDYVGVLLRKQTP